MPEVRLLALVAAGLTSVFRQLGQLPKQLIRGNIGLWHHPPTGALSIVERCVAGGRRIDHLGGCKGSTW